MALDVFVRLLSNNIRINKFGGYTGGGEDKPVVPPDNPPDVPPIIPDRVSTTARLGLAMLGIMRLGDNSAGREGG